jgi:hypothetical protein
MRIGVMVNYNTIELAPRTSKKEVRGRGKRSEEDWI